jgi:hypothetical protein
MIASSGESTMTQRTVRGGSCVVRPFVFLFLAGLLVMAVRHVSSYVPSGDLFAGAAETAGHVAIDLTVVPVATIAAFKIRHAEMTPTVDVALFGNSRVLPVSASDLNLPSCRFFNFALSGESLRGNVALVEHLSAVGKSPHVTVIGIDNFETQLYGNPAWPSIAERWRLMGKDLLAGWRRTDISTTEWLRMGWRYLNTEGEIFRYSFERTFFLSGLNLWWHGIGKADNPRNEGPPHYLTDGSLPYTVAGVDRQADVPVPSAPEQIMDSYLRYDLERLATLASAERRIVVYEAPLAPASARHFQTAGSTMAARQRGVFLDTCRKLGLACYANPGVFAPEAAWRDATHPPPAPLGAYIRGLVAKSEESGGTSRSSTPALCNHDL